MKIFLKNSSGFSLVGALTASAIGAIAVLGLAKLSSNIVGTLNKSRKEANFMNLTEDIKRAFQGRAPCDHTQTTDDCYNSCTSSLLGLSTTGSEVSVSIKEPSQTGVGAEKYKGGDIIRGVIIQQIAYKPSTLPQQADVRVHFSISDDTKETLTAPPSLHFSIFIDEEDAGKIRRCTVSSSEIALGSGLTAAQVCRKVEAGKTLVGCGGTEDVSGSESTALGYKAGGDTGSGNFSSGPHISFLGYEAGKKNTTGENNTFIGYQAGLNNTTGSYNTFLGYRAGDNNTTGIYNVVIGNNVDVPGGATQRDQLNIGDLLQGQFPNSAKYPPLHPNASKPKVIIKKGLAAIEPMDLPTPTYSSSTFPEPSLSVHGEIKIQEKTTTTPRPEVTIKAEGTATSPEAVFIADAFNLKRKSSPGHSVKLKVDGSSSNPILSINSDLKIAGAMTGSGSGLTSKGRIRLKSRTTTTPSTQDIDLRARGTGTNLNLNISGNLTVEPCPPTAPPACSPPTSSISENLSISNNLNVQRTGTFEDTLTVTDENTFATLEANGTTTFPSSVIITQADITTINGGTTINAAQFTSLNPNSHTHPPHDHDSTYALVGHTHALCPCTPLTCTCPCPSSETLKENIKPFKDYEKSLRDILKTPLFTYQYKKGKGDHPEKVRMGVISEELPKDLQILEKGKPSTPDWLSIYGTLWAGIKALGKQLNDFKVKNTQALTEISKELKTFLSDQMEGLKKEITTQLESLKNQIAKTEKTLEKQSETLTRNTRELSELKKQFRKTLLPLQNSYQEELKKTREELENTKKQLKKNLSLHSLKSS